MLHEPGPLLDLPRLVADEVPQRDPLTSPLAALQGRLDRGQVAQGSPRPAALPRCARRVRVGAAAEDRRGERGKLCLDGRLGGELDLDLARRERVLALLWWRRRRDEGEEDRARVRAEVDGEDGVGAAEGVALGVARLRGAE